MKRNILLGALALALGTTNVGLGRAQSAVDASSVGDAASNATAGATGDADASTSASGASVGADAGATASPADTSADVSSGANTDTGASASTDAGTQSTTADPSSASLDAQAGATTAPTSAPAATQPDNSAIDASANAGATTEQSATADAAANADASATPDANVDASLQGQANSTGVAAAQQNLSTGLQFGRATQQGLALNTVARNSFFYNSGLRPGDVLISYAGRPIRSQADFIRWAVYQPGQRIPVIVLRDGRQETIYVTYQQRGQVQHQAAYTPQPGAAYLGLSFDANSQDGALVRSVAPGSPAERAGIRTGHLIVSINGQPVRNHQEVIGFVAGQQPGTQVDLAVAHPVVLGARPNAAQASYQPAVQASPPTVPSTPTAPVATGAVETGVYEQEAPAVRAGANAVVRPGDADGDGRVLDGDGRIGPLERATINGRRR